MVQVIEQAYQELDGSASRIERTGSRQELAESEQFFRNFFQANRIEVSQRFDELCAHVNQKYFQVTNAD